MKFKSEEERVKAIEDLGDDPGKLDQLEEIRKAEIGTEEAPAQHGADTAPQGAIPAEKQVPVEGAEKVLPDAGQPNPTQEWAGHKSKDDLVKAHKELESTLDRQGKKIRELMEQMSQQSQADPSLVSRLEKAERELAEAKKQSPTQVPQGTVKDIKGVRQDLAAVAQRLDQLDAKAEADPEFALTPEYAKEHRALLRQQTQKISDLADLYERASTEIDGNKKFINEFTENQRKSSEREKVDSYVSSIHEQMDKLGEDEYKMSKPTKEVEGDYLKWRKDVAFAYYGRPAKSDSEEFAALDQLQLKNPDLIQKCQTMRVKTEPGDDIQRYIKLAELLDYMDGFVRDPVTGKFNRMTRYDGVTGQNVPIVHRDLKSALQAKRLEEGYYQQKSEGAYQRGAQDVANAAMRRDQGAVTLDGGADHGQSATGVDWATKILIETDAEVAMSEYRRGNKAKFEDIQKARAILKMDPIVFD